MNTDKVLPSAFFVELLKKYPQDFSARIENVDRTEVFVVTNVPLGVSVAVQQHLDGLSCPSFMDATHFLNLSLDDMLFIRSWTNDWIKKQAYEETLKKDRELVDTLANRYAKDFVTFTCGSLYSVEE